jgi:DNA-binding protein HU-beta
MYGNGIAAKIQSPLYLIGKSMKKSEMIDHIAATHELTKVEASRVLDTVIGIIHTDLKKEGRCSIPNLGTFTVSKRAARTGRNPATGEALKIKASKVTRFKPAPALKEVAAKAKV